MLKVIIADDEKIQREGLLKHILWKDFDMEVAGCAGDGVEALELVKRHMPDILVTDVKMPKMDGLALAQKAKEIDPKLKIIIISGYEEFEFAKTAIEVAASAYILKPINMAKMRAELENICSKHKTELQKEEEINEMRRHLEDSKPLLRDKFVKDIVYGFIKDEETIRRRSGLLNIRLPDVGYHTFLVDIDFTAVSSSDEEKKVLFGLNINRYLEEISVQFGEFIITQHRDCEFILIVFNSRQGSEEILLLAEALKNSIEERFNESVTIGISTLKSHILQANEGYKEAETALKQKFYLGKGKCIQYEDTDTGTVDSISLDDAYDELLSSIGIGDIDMVEETVERIFDLLSKPSAVQENYVRAFCFRAMSGIYRVLYDMNEKVENIFGEENILWSKIYRFDTIPDVRQWLKNIIMTVTQYIFNKKSKKNASVVDAVKSMLDERYYEQISVEELSKKVFLTPNYISNLFKENMGESIIDYLTRVRMRNAQRLLTESDLKIYEIAEKTGFNSVSYFSVVFKNTFGISPRDYKDSKNMEKSNGN